MPDHTHIILYQTRQEFEPPQYAKWLFRCAFVFSDARKHRSHLTVRDILDDVLAEAVLAIQANETQTFTDRLREWVDLYCGLISQAPLRTFSSIGCDTSDCVSDWGSNPVQLFWKSRISAAAAESAKELADVAVTRLDTNAEFVLAAIRILGELHRRLRDNLHPGAFLDYFRLLPIVFTRVQAWWVRTAEQNGDVEHTPCHGVLLRPPFSGTYRLILRTFAEEWRCWEKAIIPTRAKDDSARQSVQPWSVLQNGAEYLHAHMRETLMLFFGCVQRGDKEGAQWLLDILLTWRAKIEPHDIRSIVDGLPRRNWLTLEVAACAWEEAQNNWAAQWDPGWQRPDAEGSWESRVPEAIFWTALRNYWIDACYIAMVGLVAIGRDCPCETSLVARFVRMLVLGDRSGIRGGVRNEEPLGGSREWFMSLLRYYEAYGASGSPRHPQFRYLFQLRGKLREIVGLSGEAEVVGLEGSNLPVFNEEMRKDALLAIWLLLTPTPTLWDETRRVEEWVNADLFRAEVFVRDLTIMQARLESAEFKTAYQGITECAEALAGNTGFDERVTERSKVLRDMVGNLEKITRNAIAERPISKDRVQETGRNFSGSYIFTSHSRYFAVKLFGSVCVVTAGGIEGIQNQSSVFSESRAAFIESYIGSPDALYVRDHMELKFQKEVAATIIATAIEKLNPSEGSVGSPQDWWTEVKAFSEKCKKSGLQPLCVLTGQTQPPWLLGWAYQGGSDNMGKPEDLRLWWDQEWSQVDGYVGNLGDVPAFHCSSSAGQSYLLTRESLDRVTFVRWEDGYFVRASVNEGQKDDVHVALKLAWRAKVDVKEGPALWLKYDW